MGYKPIPSSPTGDDFVLQDVSSDVFEMPDTSFGESSIPEYQYDNTVATLVTRSSVYLEAHRILSSDTQYGPRFLYELESIPYSQDVADKNFWDDTAEFFGATSKHENSVTDAFNTCIDEIRALMQSYYSFLNSLPSEQVEQQKDAGYNAALTGEGVGPSSMPVQGTAPNPSAATYNNSALSQGITSFVDFVGSVASLMSGTASLGQLGVAETLAGISKDESDVNLAGQGITPRASRLDPSELARRVRVNSAQEKSTDEFLQGTHQVSLGTDPESVSAPEIFSGMDVMNQVTKFKMVAMLGDAYESNIRQEIDTRYAQVVGTLDNEYQVAHANEGLTIAGFNTEFFKARNGNLEGKSQTSLAQSLADIRDAEAEIASFNKWMSDYKFNIMSSWGEQINNKPSLAPFFYKALFDFDMTDTFYHQNALTQGLKYGMESLDHVGAFICSLVGLKKPKARTRRSESWSDGPKGTTHTTTTVIDE